MSLKNYITEIHQSTSRNYISRMMDDKCSCMAVAKKFGQEYWDGERRYGYGGYSYLPGRLSSVAKRIIKEYGLKKDSRILDIGCGKGYLLKEMCMLEPGMLLKGIDISTYALQNAHEDIKDNLMQLDARRELPYKDNEFDLVLSLGTLHNFNICELEIALGEINRVGKSAYIMVESFRNDRELFNLQCWALTCETFFSPKEWEWAFNKFQYRGDFEFIYFE